MTRWVHARWKLLAAVAGPALLFQQGCVIDPDIFVRAFVQTLSEVTVFALDNLLVGLR